ncbi:hypothetical protein JCM11491_003242 [Sporobolomyces phaffii]
MTDSARPLTAAQVKAIKSTILTEHFRFVPESFAKSCFDIANKCLYVASAWLEDELLTLVRQQAPAADAAAHDQLEEEVQTGCYRLETLLEHGIDKNFDLFEIFMLRNTFSLDDALIPHVSLSHQVEFDPTLKGSDQATLDAYEHELREYERELENERRLKAVELFLREKHARLERVKEQIGWLGFGGERTPLPQRTGNLSPSFARLTKSIQLLLDTPSPASTTVSSSRRRRHHHDKPNRKPVGSRRRTRNGPDDDDDDDEDEDADDEDLGVWNHGRTSFVNWVAGRQSSTIGGIAATTTTTTGPSSTVARGAHEGAEVGTKRDAKALLSRLEAR